MLGKPESSLEYFDIAAEETRMHGVRIVHADDVDVSLEAKTTRDAITCNGGTILSGGAFPVVLGAVHSISFPVIATFAVSDPVTIVLTDAHLD